MKPCEKYMMDASRDKEDMVFKPFNPSSYIPNFQNTPLPVMFWGNLVINPVSGGVSQFPIPYIDTINKSNTGSTMPGSNIGSTMPGSNYANTGTYNKMGTESSYNNIGYNASYNNTNMPNYNTSTTDSTKYGSSFSNFNQFGNTGTSNNVPSYDINYPDETSQSNLYSYNKNNSSLPTSTTSKYDSINVDASNTTSEYDSINVDASNSDITEVLKSLDASLNESAHLMRNINDNRIDDIYNDILDEDSNIISLFNAYKIPKPISKLILTRTIKTALNYSDNTGDKNKVGE